MDAIRECVNNGKFGFCYGNNGYCYTYERNDEESKRKALDMATKQGVAIEASKKSANYD